MSRKITILLVICLCLLAACASLEHNEVQPQPEQNEPPAEEHEQPKPVYTFEPCYADRRFYADDEPEKEIARYTYQLCTLAVSNLEELSSEDAEAAERNIETFNTRMNDMLNDYVKHGVEMGNDAVSLYVQDGTFFDNASFYDDVSSLSYLTGDIISVRLNNGSYTGGAHSNAYTSSCLFDLSTGQFIDATQLAEDPETFRTGAAELLVKKADAIQENRDGYWPEYKETISRWNENAVIFDEEGMLVVYSPYDLGPYAMGAVELRLSYDELAGLMGPGGLERLGVAENG